MSSNTTVSYNYGYLTLTAGLMCEVATSIECVAHSNDIIGKMLRHSKETDFHEFWCDGVDVVDYVANAEQFQCAGACVMSDIETRKMWLAPFEMEIEYRSKEEWPSAAMVKIGHVDAMHVFDRSLPCNKEHRLNALSHWIYGEKPGSQSKWAMNVDLDPYPTTE